MKTRILMAMVVALFVSACAVTQPRVAVNMPADCIPTLSDDGSHTVCSKDPAARLDDIMFQYNQWGYIYGPLGR